MFLVISPYSQRNGNQTDLNPAKPDAIFASDDLTAILIMKVARELDIQIPQDLKVIGYDGTQFIETYTPELTTIQQPLKDIVISMVDLLLQKIEGKVATTGYFLPVSLHSGKVFKTTPTVLYCRVIIRQKKGWAKLSSLLYLFYI